MNSSVEPAPVSDIETRPGRKQPKLHIGVSPGRMQLYIPVWQNVTSGAQVVRNIPEGYHIIEMYKTSRNSSDPNHPGIFVDGENYWPVKIRHQSTGHMKWVRLHEDEPTVPAFVEETDKDLRGYLTPAV